MIQLRMNKGLKVYLFNFLNLLLSQQELIVLLNLTYNMYITMLLIIKNNSTTKPINTILLESPKIEKVFSEASEKALVTESGIILYNTFINKL